MPLGNANWYFSDCLGYGTDYAQRTGCGFYTVESHLRYLREVRAPATLRMTFHVFGVDEKRLHTGQVLSVDGVESATFECIALNVDTNTGKTNSMPTELYQRVKARVSEPIPDWVGRGISRIGV